MADKQRALAHVEKIVNIQPIEGADNIELITVLGWKCIAKKQEFNVGDYCVYFEIDSKLPVAEWSAFMESKGYKVKTMKLSKFGVISQGLALPIRAFEGISIPEEEGTDVTKLLNVTYYNVEDVKRKADVDPNAKYVSMKARHKKIFSSKFAKWMMKREWGRRIMFFIFGKKKDKPRGFPSFVSKTDEERVENQPWRCGDGVQYVASEKCDGCVIGRTSIVTSQGLLPIKKIVDEEMEVDVLTYNHEEGVCEYRPIEAWHRYDGGRDMYKVTTKQFGVRGNREKSITCTENHMFFTNRGYVRADELRISDVIYHRKNVLNDMAKQVLLGCLLGDSSLSQKYGVYDGSVNFVHSIKQSDYFEYTKSVLGASYHTHKNKVSGYGSETLRGHYISTPDMREFILANCIRDGKKYVTKEWANALTPLSIAFWYMDDGTIQNADNNHSNASIQIATNGFSYEEVETLSEMLKVKFSIISSIKNTESYKGNVLYMDRENTDRFCTLIAPYICESMKYKLPSYLRRIKCCLEGISLDNRCGLAESPVIRVEKQDKKPYYVYDLTVQKNHNYFANGILTHNTSSTYLLERKPFGRYEFYVCSRNVRQQDENQKCYHDHNIYWDMAFKYNIKEVLKKYLKEHRDCKWVCIQGEAVGSVQGNPLKLKEDDLYVFNFIDSVNGRWGSLDGKKLIEENGMKWVPILGIATIPDSMEETKKLADGKSAINPEVMREGIVYRSLDGKSSFKNVSTQYLLSKKD